MSELTESRPFLAMAPKGVDCTAAGQIKAKPMARLRGQNKHPRLAGIGKRRKNLPKRPKLLRNIALINAAVKLWEIKNGLEPE